MTNQTTGGTYTPVKGDDTTLLNFEVEGLYWAANLSCMITIKGGTTDKPAVLRVSEKGLEYNGVRVEDAGVRGFDAQQVVDGPCKVDNHVPIDQKKSQSTASGASSQAAYKLQISRFDYNEKQTTRFSH